MFLINCPYCGERDQSEFSSGGEAHILRPKQPTELSDDQWAEFLFMRKNIKGVQIERWNHTHGCRFARTIGAQETENLAPLYIEGNRVNGLDQTKSLRQGSHLYQGGHH